MHGVAQSAELEHLRQQLVHYLLHCLLLPAGLPASNGLDGPALTQVAVLPTAGNNQDWLLVGDPSPLQDLHMLDENAKSDAEAMQETHDKSESLVDSSHHIDVFGGILASPTQCTQPAETGEPVGAKPPTVCVVQHDVHEQVLLEVCNTSHVCRIHYLSPS